MRAKNIEEITKFKINRANQNYEDVIISLPYLSKKINKSIKVFKQLATIDHDQTNWRDDRSSILLKYYCSGYVINSKTEEHRDLKFESDQISSQSDCMDVTYTNNRASQNLNSENKFLKQDLRLNFEKMQNNYDNQKIVNEKNYGNYDDRDGTLDYEIQSNESVHLLQNNSSYKDELSITNQSGFQTAYKNDAISQTHTQTQNSYIPKTISLTSPKASCLPQRNIENKSGAYTEREIKSRNMLSEGLSSDFNTDTDSRTLVLTNNTPSIYSDAKKKDEKVTKEQNKKNSEQNLIDNYYSVDSQNRKLRYNYMNQKDKEKLSETTESNCEDINSKEIFKSKKKIRPINTARLVSATKNKNLFNDDFNQQYDRKERSDDKKAQQAYKSGMKIKIVDNKKIYENDNFLIDSTPGKNREKQSQNKSSKIDHYKNSQIKLKVADDHGFKHNEENIEKTNIDGYFSLQFTNATKSTNGKKNGKDSFNLTEHNTEFKKPKELQSGEKSYWLEANNQLIQTADFRYLQDQVNNISNRANFDKKQKKIGSTSSHKDTDSLRLNTMDCDQFINSEESNQSFSPGKSHLQPEDLSTEENLKLIFKKLKQQINKNKEQRRENDVDLQSLSSYNISHSIRRSNNSISRSKSSQKKLENRFDYSNNSKKSRDFSKYSNSSRSRRTGKSKLIIAEYVAKGLKENDMGQQETS